MSGRAYRTGPPQSDSAVRPHRGRTRPRVRIRSVRPGRVRLL